MWKIKINGRMVVRDYFMRFPNSIITEIITIVIVRNWKSF